MTLEFRDTITDEKGKIDACFGEMQDCADPLILGFPEIARWGLDIDEDDDRHIWVTFKKVGATVLAEVPETEPGR